MRRLALVVCLASVVGCPRRAEPTDAAPTTNAGASASASAGAADADVMTGASTLAWEGGAPVVAGGVVDGDALRKAHAARLSKDRSPVTVLAGTDAIELGRKLCEQVVPKRPPKTPALLKPNLGGIEWFKDPAKNDGDDGLVGRTTDPEFVRGVIRCLRARGHEPITIAEGFAHTHPDWERLVRASGYEAMAREEGARLVALDDDGVFDVEGDKPGLPLAVKGMEKTGVPTLLLPKALAEHLERGLFLSLPKVKAHRFAVFSVGLKSMQGVLMYSDAKPAFHQKWRSHRELAAALKATGPDARKQYVASLETFAERMTDVLEVAAPDAVLAEGLPAMGGDGFGKQWPSADSFVVGGTNAVMVDRVAAELLGFWDNAALEKEIGHRTSPLLESAAKRFGLDVSKPDVVGDGASLLGAPRPYHLAGMGGFSLHSDATPATHPRMKSPASDGGAPAAASFELHAKQAASAPAIDGDDKDAVWSAASPASFDADWSGKATGKTTVRAAWDAGALYAIFSLEGAGLATDRARDPKVEREKLWEEDCVELFVGPDAKTPARYYEIEVGPYGHFLDLAVDRAKKKSNVGWSGDLAIGTKQDAAARTATIELAVRSPDVTRALKKGARLPLALYRMEGKKPRLYLAWSPTRTPKPDFHVPDAFGTLVVE